jgi:hypothetical protein
MSVVIKSGPGALEEWFRRTYPHIDPSTVCFTQGSICQDELSPFKSQIIVSYRETGDRLHVNGFFCYGDDFMHGLRALKVWVPPSPPPVENVWLPPWEDECDMDDVKDRIDWIIFSRPPRRQSFSAFRLLLCIGPYVPDFYRLQMTRERAAFKLGGDENAIAHFLRDHGFAPRLNLLEAPTVSDQRRAWTQWKYEPRVWLNVPMEEFPEIRGLELYPGGYYHVTLMDVAAHWVWKHLTHGTGKRNKTRHPEQMVHLINYIRERMHNRPGELNVGNPSNDRLAPCIQAILSAERFPQDRERQLLVRVMSNAKISLDYVRTRLEELNERYPHADGEKPLRLRWDYESHYTTNYAPPTCEHMGNLCPFEGRIDQKKAACFNRFVAQFPKATTPKPWQFKGPKNWFDW